MSGLMDVEDAKVVEIGGQGEWRGVVVKGSKTEATLWGIGIVVFGVCLVELIQLGVEEGRKYLARKKFRLIKEG